MVGRDDGGEVEDRSGGRGQREAIVLADLPLVQVGGVVNTEVALDLDPAARWHRDLDERPAPRPQSPLSRRAAVAQHGVITHRQDCGKDMSLSPQLRMAEGIHAAAHDDQPPVPPPMIDAARTQSERQQLPPRDHAVLSSDELADRN